MGKIFQIAPEKDNKKTMRRKGSNPLHVKEECEIHYCAGFGERASSAYTPDEPNLTAQFSYSTKPSLRTLGRI